MKAKLKLTIDAQGAIKVDTVQGAGSKCRMVTDLLAGDLGIKADETSRADTEDFYVEGSNDLTVSN